MIEHIDPPYIVTLSHHPQLFLDDHCVGNTINISRRIQQPTKFAGNPIVVSDQPWERPGGLIRPAVIYEPQLDRFRMHYTTYDVLAQEGFHATCYAESDDGFTWRKPLVDRVLHDAQPSNIVEGPCHAIRTANDSQQGYVGVTSTLNGDTFRERGLYLFNSADGLDWGKPRKITETKCDTVPNIVWHEPVKRYFIYTRSQAYHPKLYGHMRITGVMQSPDLENWTPKRAINLITESHGFPYVQVHALTAHAYGDLLVGELPVFNLEEPGNNFLNLCNVQLATSRDGWHWQRVADGAVFLPHGPEDWDRWFVHSCSMVRKGDLLYFYFWGCPQKHGALRQLREQGVKLELTGGDYAIGVATLPADRFLALEPNDPADPGILDTPPVRCQGRELLVNAQVEPADLQVELIDEQGPVAPFQAQPLAGFEREHSRLVRQDDLRYRVFWQSNGAQRTLGDAAPHQPFIIRFTLNRGQLFAFEVK